LYISAYSRSPVHDNRALSRASAQAQQDAIPLVAFFVLSPQDYIAHDRGARKIDFILRNLSAVKVFHTLDLQPVAYIYHETCLAQLDIPLHTVTHAPRATLPSHILSLLKHLGATHLFANIEYELDELRRDIKVCELAKQLGVNVELYHDRCVVPPGVIKTKDDRAYTVSVIILSDVRGSQRYQVYSPYLRQWVSQLNACIAHHLEDCPPPAPNDPAIRRCKILGPLFETGVPHMLAGFELDEVNGEKDRMQEVWPAGEDAAKEVCCSSTFLHVVSPSTCQKILYRFLNTASRPTQMGAVNPLEKGAQISIKNSRLKEYNVNRDKADEDTTSRLRFASFERY